MDKTNKIAAHNALVSVIEYVGRSGLIGASGDSLLLDDLNNLRRRLVADARRVGIEAEA